MQPCDALIEKGIRSHQLHLYGIWKYSKKNIHKKQSFLFLTPFLQHGRLIHNQIKYQLKFPKHDQFRVQFGTLKSAKTESEKEIKNSNFELYEIGLNSTLRFPNQKFLRNW